MAATLEDQCRIADFLDAETARIDTLAERRKRQRAVLEERAYAVVSEALLPGVLTAPAGNRPLQNGLTVDSKRDLSGEVVTRPYLRVANVQAGYLDLDSVAEVTVPREMADRTTLRSGDVLMTEGGDLDKLGRGTVWRDQLPGCLHQNHIFALRPEPGRLDGDYLALMTQTVHGRCYFESTGSRTTNLASTSSGKILDFPIPLPSIEWQRKLVEQVRGRLDSMARANAKLDSQLNLLTERRAALITAAVTGRIDVPTASGRGVENP